MAASPEIIARLEQILTDYITMGAKMQLEIIPLDLLRVLDRVIATVEHGPQPDWDFTNPREAFLEGLVEELLDHPNTVYEIAADEEGSTFYRALDKQTWLDSLYQLREQLENQP
jgi:hypothetical protein